MQIRQSGIIQPILRSPLTWFINEQNTGNCERGLKKVPQNVLLLIPCADGIKKVLEKNQTFLRLP